MNAASMGNSAYPGSSGTKKIWSFPSHLHRSQWPQAVPSETDPLQVAPVKIGNCSRRKPLIFRAHTSLWHTYLGISAAHCPAVFIGYSDSPFSAMEALAVM